jgi:glycine dehydrogenase
MSTAPVVSDFQHRHIGPSYQETAEMLAAVGASSLDELMAQTVPGAIRQRAPLDVGPALSEPEALARMRQIAARNQVMTSLIGQGYHGTHTPLVILRNILENPAWYTAYTPYQPEISQGRLEALLNFQTMITELTGLDVANASLLDEGTAAAEAMAVAQRSVKTKLNAFFVDADCHPQTIAVLRTRAEPLGWTVVVGDPATPDLDPTLVFGACCNTPARRARCATSRAIAKIKAAGALAILAADPLALCLLTPPGELGADMAIGSTQRFGVPMGFGGPHAAYMAVRDSLKRSMPGRLIGVSIDSRGNRPYRLALQTREQHIRREKATSNICTAQVLLAVIASMYAVYHGPEGLRAIAEPRAPPRRDAGRGPGQLGFACAATASSTHHGGRAGRAPAGHRRTRAGRGDQPARPRWRTRWRSPSTRPPRRPPSRPCGRPSAARSAMPMSTAGAANCIPAALLRHGACLTHPVFQPLPLRNRDAALPAHLQRDRTWRSTAR